MGRISYGLIATNANKNPVLSQLIAVSETPKYCDEVVETAEKVSHFHNISILFNESTPDHKDLHPSSR
jgi:hypothetical protein